MRSSVEVQGILRVQQKTIFIEKKKLSPCEKEFIQRNKDNRKILLPGEKGRKAQSFGAQRTSPRASDQLAQAH